MAIDTSGKWWKGSSADDLAEYLRNLTRDSYPIDEFRLARCCCGEIRFNLEVEPDEGIAKRTCVQCRREHLIADSADNYEPDQHLERFECIDCKSSVANVGVGYSLYQDREAVR